MALPWLLVALPAGAVVDRLNPARVMVAANLIRAAVAALLVLAVASDSVSVTLLCIAGFAFTAAETFADSASQSLLVQMVPAGKLERANARFIGSENLGLDLVGPLAAGALFSVALWLPFLISAVIFASTAVLMVGMPDRRGAVGEDPEPPMSPGRPAARPSVFEGLRTIVGDSGLRTLVAAVAVMGGSVAAVEGVLVIYSTSSLHLSESLYPTLLACYSVGLLISAALVGRFGPRAAPGPLMVAAVAVIGLTLVGLGLFPHPAVAWSCFGLMGGAGGVWNVLSATRRQRRTPPHLVARVSSTFRAIGWGALPLGAALGGLGSERLGVPAVCVMAGLVVLLLGCAIAPHFLRSDTTTAPAIRRGRRTQRV